jgi:hypothetical protein
MKEILKRKMFENTDMQNMPTLADPVGVQKGKDFEKLIGGLLSLKEKLNLDENVNLAKNIDRAIESLFLEKINKAQDFLTVSKNPQFESRNSYTFEKDIPSSFFDTTTLFAQEMGVPFNEPVPEIGIRFQKKFNVGGFVQGNPMFTNPFEDPFDDVLPPSGFGPDFSNLDTTIEESIEDLNQDNIPVEEVVEVQLDPFQYRSSTGQIFDIDPDRFLNSLSAIDRNTLAALIQNPEVEYGQGLRRIIRDRVAFERSEASDVNPETFKFGEMLPDYLSFGSGLQDFVSPGLVAVERIGLDIATLPERILNPLFGRAGDPFKKEYISKEEFNKLPLIQKLNPKLVIESEYFPDEENPLEQDLSGRLRRGKSVEELDLIVVGLDPINVELEQLDEGETPPDPDAEVKTEDPEEITSDSPEEEINVEKDNDKADLEEAIVDSDVKTGFTKKEDIDKGFDTAIAAKKLGLDVFSSDKFLRAIRNIGSQLVEQGTMGAGLAKGAAAFAKEEAARELAKQKFQEELLIKSAGALGKEMKFSDIEAVAKRGDKLNQSIKDFEGNQSALALMDDAIRLFETARDKGEAVTGFPGAFNRFKDQFIAAAGIEGIDTSSATQIQNLITVLKNRSIREILNESGRTISNLDRQIVDQVFGKLDLTSKPDEILKKLKNSRQQLVDNALKYQSDVRLNASALKQPAAGQFGQEYLLGKTNIIAKILAASDFSKAILDQKDINTVIAIDL